MARTVRSARIFSAPGVSSAAVVPDGPRPRADRDERLRRASRDAKRIERAERFSDRHEGEQPMRLGSTVRTVAA